MERARRLYVPRCVHPAAIPMADDVHATEQIRSCSGHARGRLNILEQKLYCTPGAVHGKRLVPHNVNMTFKLSQGQASASCFCAVKSPTPHSFQQGGCGDGDRGKRNGAFHWKMIEGRRHCIKFTARSRLQHRLPGAVFAFCPAVQLWARSLSAQGAKTKLSLHILSLTAFNHDKFLSWR